MNLQRLPNALEGEVLADAVLAPFEVARMNFARQECEALEQIILSLVIPAIGEDHPISCDMRRHIEQIVSFSGNFCWHHRHIGRMHDAVSAGGNV